MKSCKVQSAFNTTVTYLIFLCKLNISFLMHSCSSVRVGKTMLHPLLPVWHTIFLWEIQEKKHILIFGGFFFLSLFASGYVNGFLTEESQESIRNSELAIKCNQRIWFFWVSQKKIRYKIIKYCACLGLLILFAVAVSAISETPELGHLIYIKQNYLFSSKVYIGSYSFIFMTTNIRAL